MNTYLMKKAMIETAVDMGLKQMEEDPKRSVRRLTDLGKQFSKNRFQDMLFSVMQELLDNEDSAYYDMMRNLLANSDREALKKFGINFGYMGWTYGAAQIREYEKESGCCIPWTMLLRYDPVRMDGQGCEMFNRLIQSGQELGIYVYFIREAAGASDESYALLETLERYKECAFIWFKGNGRLTAAQIQMLKLCKSTLISLPLDDPETLLTVSLLKDQKIPFSLHMEYDGNAPQETYEKDVKEKLSEELLGSQTAFFFLIAKDGTPCSLRQLAYDSRMQQKHPYVAMDYYGDTLSLSRILCEQTNLFELDSDGTILQPQAHRGETFDQDVPLLDAFAKVMPAFPPEQAQV